MKTRKWKLLIAAALALFAVVAVAPVAFARWGGGYGAADGTGPLIGEAFGANDQASPQRGYGPMHDTAMVGGSQYSLVTIAAEKIGIDRTALVTELQAGKTIADVAAEHNVTVDTIVNAVVAQREAQLKEAVSANQITQAQADALLAQIKTHVTELVTSEWTFHGPGAGNGAGLMIHR